MLNAILLAVRFVIRAFSGHKQVASENAALRQQLAVFKRDVKRPKLHGRDRVFWIALRMIWEDWKSALVIVQPETVVSWHRNRFKRYWRQLSRPKMPGRPPVTGEIRKLVRTMASANPLWGAPRVHGELLKLGFEISERTVSRLMPKKEGKPAQTWMTFLRNHAGQIVSIDLFTVATIQLRVLCSLFSRRIAAEWCTLMSQRTPRLYGLHSKSSKRFQRTRHHVTWCEIAMGSMVTISLRE